MGDLSARGAGGDVRDGRCDLVARVSAAAAFGIQFFSGFSASGFLGLWGGGQGMWAVGSIVGIGIQSMAPEDELRGVLGEGASH